MERCCQKAVIHQIPLISRAIRLKTGAGDDESWKKGKVSGTDPISHSFSPLSDGRRNAKEETKLTSLFPSPLSSSPLPQRTLLTEGSNFRAIWEHANEFVDMNYLYSNDIAAILHAYGVEAARASIIAEVSGVFGVYAITINCQSPHLNMFLATKRRD